MHDYAIGNLLYLFGQLLKPRNVRSDRFSRQSRAIHRQPIEEDIRPVAAVAFEGSYSDLVSVGAAVVELIVLRFSKPAAGREYALADVLQDFAYHATDYPLTACSEAVRALREAPRPVHSENLLIHPRL